MENCRVPTLQKGATMTDTSKQSIDDILVIFFNEVEMDVHSDNFNGGSVFTKAGTHAKAQLALLFKEMMEEVIGEDETTERIHPTYLPEVKALNKLRADQRTKLAQRIAQEFEG
jgi:hypothetical protein